MGNSSRHIASMEYAIGRLSLNGYGYLCLCLSLGMGMVLVLVLDLVLVLALGKSVRPNIVLFRFVIEFPEGIFVFAVSQIAKATW